MISFSIFSGPDAGLPNVWAAQHPHRLMYRVRRGVLTSGTAGTETAALFCELGKMVGKAWFLSPGKRNPKRAHLVCISPFFVFPCSCRGDRFRRRRVRLSPATARPEPYLVQALHHSVYHVIRDGRIDVMWDNLSLLFFSNTWRGRESASARIISL